jgi:hypothetical protein
MRPEPFQNGEWLNLKEVFNFAKSGMKSGDDDVFVSPVRTRLRSQVAPILARQRYAQYDAQRETFYSYRPLDRRWFYNDLRLLDRPGPAMQRVWGRDNVCLYAVPGGTGAGPAVWCHGLLPDYHAFRGSNGGYTFPLYDRRPNIDAANISLALIQMLSAAYGVPVAATEVFDAILCLLSATSYSLLFAEDLEDVFPHIPFPHRPEVFHSAVRVGREIRAVETFGREPAAAYRRSDFVRVITEPCGVMVPVEHADDEISLCGDGSGRIIGLPHDVWEFSVSSYRVLPRWLDARVGLPADFGLVRELRAICGRIAELIDLFAEADTVLETTLHETLTREALGFAPAGQDANDR